MSRLTLIVALAAAIPWSGSAIAADKNQPTATQSPTFEKGILPILKARCFT